jgi:hypothetical protein
MSFGRKLVAWVGSEIIRLVVWIFSALLALTILVFLCRFFKLEGLSTGAIILVLIYPIYKLIRVPIDRFIEKVLLGR